MNRNTAIMATNALQTVRKLTTISGLHIKGKSPSTPKSVSYVKAFKSKAIFKSNDEFDIYLKRLPRYYVRKVFKESIYDPFDFSLDRIRLERNVAKSEIPLNSINPSDLYMSPEILTSFVSPTGKILHSDITGLNVKDQKRISKAIRRCQAMGLMSKTSNDYNR